MKSVSSFSDRSVAFTCAALVGLVAVTGCNCGSSKQAHETAQGYTGAANTPQEPPPAVAQGESTATGNTVIPLYQESLKVGTREVETGTVRVRKIVKTETVNQPVVLRHEEVVIDRQPSSQTQPSGTAFQEQDFTIHLKREEPVVEKTVSSSGEIVVQTKQTSEQTNLTAQVRREDIDIARTGDAQNVVIGQNVQASSTPSGASGSAESPGGTATVTSESTPITDASMVGSATAGRTVQLSGLKVDQVIGDRVYVLTTDSGQKIYAVGQSSAGLKTGDTVNLTGTVKPSSGSSALGLSSDAAQTLSSQPMYIDAQKLEK